MYTTAALIGCINQVTKSHTRASMIGQVLSGVTENFNDFSVKRKCFRLSPLEEISIFFHQFSKLLMRNIFLALQFNRDNQAWVKMIGNEI